MNLKEKITMYRFIQIINGILPNRTKVNCNLIPIYSFIYFGVLCHLIDELFTVKFSKQILVARIVTIMQ